MSKLIYDPFSDDLKDHLTPREACLICFVRQSIRAREALHAARINPRDKERHLTYARRCGASARIWYQDFLSES